MHARHAHLAWADVVDVFGARWRAPSDGDFGDMEILLSMMDISFAATRAYWDLLYVKLAHGTGLSLSRLRCATLRESLTPWPRLGFLALCYLWTWYATHPSSEMFHDVVPGLRVERIARFAVPFQAGSSCT